jgi:hypothetical protein
MGRRDITQDPDPNRYHGAIKSRVLTFLDSAEGKFYLRDVYDYCDGHDDRMRATIRQVLYVERKEGRIKSEGDRAGCYRKVQSNFNVVDLASLEEEPSLDVLLPLGLDRFVSIYPRDLIIYAGVSNVGKSIFALETVRLNMLRFPCYFFSTEMSAQACRKRISAHRDTPLQNWKINFVDSFASYTDIIQPDALNFIDYVEAPEGEFFKIPSILSGIHNRLRKGVAIVTLQKNPGLSHGVGGFQTQAKAAIFITLENNIATVQKAKNWNKINPNQFQARYETKAGINLCRIGDWISP